MNESILALISAIVVAGLNLVGNYAIQKAQSEKDNALQDERIKQVKSEVSDLKEKVEQHNNFGIQLAKLETRVDILEKGRKE